MSKRLEMLEALTAKGSSDPFAWYGLGMEYKNLGRLEEAVATFEKLRSLDPSYLAVYLMAGEAQVSSGNSALAREWFQTGLALAREQQNDKAASELQTALEELSEND